MRIFGFFKRTDIHVGMQAYIATENAVLLDVRTSQEYRKGHIPESKNVPLQTIENVVTVAPNKDTPLFVYCHSGVRSRRAAAQLQRMGYTDVKNIGGIAAYSGRLDR